MHCDTFVSYRVRFFLVKGSVAVLSRDDDGAEHLVATLNDGSFFGEVHARGS